MSTFSHHRMQVAEIALVRHEICRYLAVLVPAYEDDLERLSSDVLANRLCTLETCARLLSQACPPDKGG